MWFLCLQVVLLIAGIYALLTGKLPVTANVRLEGKRARIMGGLLLLPLGVPVSYGIVFTVIAVASGHPEDFTPHAEALDVPSMLGAIALAIAFLYVTRAKHESTG